MKQQRKPLFENYIIQEVEEKHTERTLNNIELLERSLDSLSTNEPQLS